MNTVKKRLSDFFYKFFNSFQWVEISKHYLMLNLRVLQKRIFFTFTFLLQEKESKCVILGVMTPVDFFHWKQCKFHDDFFPEARFEYWFIC